MLREYEVTIIAHPHMQEDDRKGLIEKYENMILADGGEIIRKSEWGSKKLASPIKKQFRGYYVHYDLTSMPENLKKAEQTMRIDENILRYLSIKVGENVDVDARKAELAKIASAAAAQKEASNSFRERSSK